MVNEQYHLLGSLGFILGDYQSIDTSLSKTRNRGCGVTSVASGLGCKVVEEALPLIQGGHRSAIQTLGDGLVEDLLAGGNQVKEDGGTASALPIDGDLVGVSTEVVDVVLDPFQGLNLIQETHVVIGNSPTGEIRVGEESESCQTVVDRDDDDFLTLVDPVIVRQNGGVPEEIAPSVDIEQHGYWP